MTHFPPTHLAGGMQKGPFSPSQLPPSGTVTQTEPPSAWETHVPFATHTPVHGELLAATFRCRHTYDAPFFPQYNPVNSSH